MTLGKLYPLSVLCFSMNEMRIMIASPYLGRVDVQVKCAKTWKVLRMCQAHSKCSVKFAAEATLVGSVTRG